jgi:hypothetical protein
MTRVEKRDYAHDLNQYEFVLDPEPEPKPGRKRIEMVDGSEMLTNRGPIVLAEPPFYKRSAYTLAVLLFALTTFIIVPLPWYFALLAAFGAWVLALVPMMIAFAREDAQRQRDTMLDIFEAEEAKEKAEAERLLRQRFALEDDIMHSFIAECKDAEMEQAMKITHGNWQVVRKCCTSGCCIECRAAFDKAKRKTIMHMGNLSKETAEAVAENWRMYDAKAVPMT